MSDLHISELPQEVQAALRRVPKFEPDGGRRRYCACGHSDRLHVETRHGTGCAGRSHDHPGGCECAGLHVVFVPPIDGWNPRNDEAWAQEALRRGGGV